MEASAGGRQRMSLELNDIWLSIVSLRPALLLVRDFRWVVAVEVVSRVAFAWGVLALVFIAHASAARHLAIALALPLATCDGCEREVDFLAVGLSVSSLVGAGRAGGGTYRERRRRAISGGPDGRPQASPTATAYGRCRWAWLVFQAAGDRLEMLLCPFFAFRAVGTPERDDFR